MRARDSADGPGRLLTWAVVGWGGRSRTNSHAPISVAATRAQSSPGSGTSSSRSGSTPACAAATTPNSGTPHTAHHAPAADAARHQRQAERAVLVDRRDLALNQAARGKQRPEWRHDREDFLISGLPVAKLPSAPQSTPAHSVHPAASSWHWSK